MSLYPIKRPYLVQTLIDGVDPQFCPQHLHLSYGCHTYPSFSYGTIRALLGLIGLRASGGLICGPLSAYVVHFGVSSWLLFSVIGIVP